MLLRHSNRHCNGPDWPRILCRFLIDAKRSASVMIQISYSGDSRVPCLVCRLLDCLRNESVEDFMKLFTTLRLNQITFAFLSTLERIQATSKSFLINMHAGSVRGLWCQADIRYKQSPVTRLFGETLLFGFWYGSFSPIIFFSFFFCHCQFVLPTLTTILMLKDALHFTFFSLILPYIN